jgi:predicted RNase H-like HicB family nuclease
MKYTVIITYDSEYKGYVVDVPELTGCMSQGKSLDEALKNIKDAIKGWLFVEKKHKRTVQRKRQDIFLGEVAV